jgi:hypothetical protein
VHRLQVLPQEVIFGGGNAAASFFLDGSTVFGYDNSTYSAEERYVHVFFFLRTHFLHMPFVE